MCVRVWVRAGYISYFDVARKNNEKLFCRRAIYRVLHAAVFRNVSDELFIFDPPHCERFNTILHADTQQYILSSGLFFFPNSFFYRTSYYYCYYYRLLRCRSRRRTTRGRTHNTIRKYYKQILCAPESAQQVDRVLAVKNYRKTD